MRRDHVANWTPAANPKDAVATATATIWTVVTTGAPGQP